MWALLEARTIEDRIELPLAGVNDQAVQLWPGIFCAGFANIDVFAEDLELPRTAECPQIA
jgi:hypothetical protein